MSVNAGVNSGTAMSLEQPGRNLVVDGVGEGVVVAVVEGERDREGVTEDDGEELPDALVDADIDNEMV